MSYDIGYVSNNEIITSNNNLISEFKWGQEMKKHHIVENCNQCGFFCKMHGFDFYCRHTEAVAKLYKPATYKEQLEAKEDQYDNCPLDDYPEEV